MRTTALLLTGIFVAAAATSANALGEPATRPSLGLEVPAGTALRFHVNTPLSSGVSKSGEHFAFTLLDAIAVGGIIVSSAGAQGAGTVLLAGHAGSKGHEGDLTIRLDSIDTPDGNQLGLNDQQIKLNGRNHKVAVAALGFVPFVGMGARLIRGEESVVSASTEIHTVLTAAANVRARVEPAPSSMPQ